MLEASALVAISASSPSGMIASELVNQISCGNSYSSSHPRVDPRSVVAWFWQPLTALIAKNRHVRNFPVTTGANNHTAISPLKDLRDILVRSILRTNSVIIITAMPRINAKLVNSGTVVVYVVNVVMVVRVAEGLAII